MSDRIVLTRTAYLPDGTFGELVFPNGIKMFTVEKPWKENIVSESCIPDGVYRMGMRESPVVRRSSGGEFHEGWEVLDVEGRSYIMLHPGNWPCNFQGCIGVGDSLSYMTDKRGRMTLAVTNSRNTFRRLMEELDTRYEWELEIRPTTGAVL